MTARLPDDHVHPDSWSKSDHHRFEDRMNDELTKIEHAIASLTTRVTLMIGGLTLVAILLPVLAPFVRALLNLDAPSGQ